MAETSSQGKSHAEGGMNLLLGEVVHPSYLNDIITLDPSHHSPNYLNTPRYRHWLDAVESGWVNRKDLLDQVVRVKPREEKPTAAYNAKSTLSPRDSPSSPNTRLARLKHPMNFVPLAEGPSPLHPKSPVSNEVQDEWILHTNGGDEGSSTQRSDSATMFRSLTSSSDSPPISFSHTDEPQFLAQIDDPKSSATSTFYWNDSDSLLSRHHRNSSIGGRKCSIPYSSHRSTRATAVLGAVAFPSSSTKHLQVPSFLSNHPSERTPDLSVHTPQLTRSPHSPISPSFVSPYLSPIISFEQIMALPSQDPLSGPTISTEPDEQISHRLGAGMTSGQPPGTGPPLVIPSQLLLSDVPVPLIAPELLHMPVREDTDTFLRLSFLDSANIWRRRILDAVLSSSFLKDNEMEPVDRGPSDPITHGNGKKGKSIYAVFVEEANKGEWRCLFGSPMMPCPNNAIFKRFERAVEHVRSHLNHRPYKCTGECDVGASCKRRFYAQQYLRDHLNRKGKTQCSTCLRSVLVQNLARHQIRHSTGKP